MKKSIFSFILTIIVLVISLSLYIYKPQFFQSFENKIIDIFFQTRGEKPTDNRIVIIDIDEKSLKVLGQWPWSRNKIAKIIDNLTNAEVGIIGLDIVFAEEDRTSPKKLFEDFNLSSKDLDIKDYDEILAKTIASSPLIGGYVFNFEDVVNQEKEISIPAIFIQKGICENPNIFLEPIGILPNIDKLQNAMYSSGFFNTFPDSDGIVRQVPLIFKYNDMFYPSLALEMLRVATSSSRVYINVDELGVESIALNDISIPVSDNVKIFVNYKGAQKSYKYISALDIYNNNFKKEDILGNFALVGTSAVGLFDLRATPFDNVYPGIEIHATVIDNILNNDFLSKPSWDLALNILITITASILILIFSLILSALLSAIMSMLFIGGFAYTSYYLFANEGLIISTMFPLINMFLVWLLTMLVNYIYESRQKEMIKQKFSKKVSKAVVEELMKNPNSDSLDGVEKEVTIFFSDVRSFTSISEELGSATKIIDFLNHYMTPMSDIIMETKGTIDKYIGDAIMAYWNAPNSIKDHQDVAVTSSLNQLAILDELNEKMKTLDFPSINIGIGLNTGLVTVGEMGSEGRSDYTVIGDPVNLASRLEGLCKPYGVKLIISEYVKKGLKKEYVIRELDLVRVKGKKLPVSVFEVLDFNENKEQYVDELRDYDEALKLYKNSNFKEAKEKFEILHTQYSKKLFIVYIQRCEYFIENPPIDFDGVFTFTTK